VHSRVKDEWGNDTIKLRVENPTEQPAYSANSSTATGQSPSVDPISRVEAIQAEAKETAKKQGWQSTCVYFENAERGLYQVVLAENTEHMRQTIQEGLIPVGFIGIHDAPKGIQFEFTLDDGFPMNGLVAKRFLANGREWVATRSKDLCTQQGIAAPIVHDFKPSKEFASAQLEGSPQNLAYPKQGLTWFKFGIVLAIAGLLIALKIIPGEWRDAVEVVLPVGVVVVVAYLVAKSRG